jgi:hypothetical protein
MTMTTTTQAPAATTTSPRRRLTLGPVIVLVAVVVTSLAAWLLRGGDDPKAPYTDPAATGSIGLCDPSGHQVTSGSADTAPFIWRAVGTTPAPTAYSAPGSSATLYAFQPRAGAEPTEWSGQQLTAAGRYSDPAHPMAAATANDVPLADFLAAYPAVDKGFVQLRLYLTAPGQPPLTTGYDALDIVVSGDSWHAVGGADVDCTAGSSVSFEDEIKSIVSGEK